MRPMGDVRPASRATMPSSLFAKRRATMNVAAANHASGAATVDVAKASDTPAAMEKSIPARETALGETPFATRYLAIAMGSLRSFRSTRGQGFACVRGAACAFSAGALVPGASSSVTLVMCPPRVCPTKDAKEGDRGRGFFRGAPRDGRRKGSPAHGLTRTRDAAMPERSPHVEPYDG